MKYFFKLMLIWSFTFLIKNLYARDIVLIQHFEKKEKAKLIYSILTQNLNIPPKLITLKEKSDPCKVELNSIIMICLNEDGEMLIPYRNHEVLKRSLSVFTELKGKI